MKALTLGPVRRSDVAAVMQRDDATSTRLVADLVADGLCLDADPLTLP